MVHQQDLSFRAGWQLLLEGRELAHQIYVVNCLKNNYSEEALANIDHYF